MASLPAVLLVSALLSCGVNGQFNDTITCPSSGKKTLKSELKSVSVEAGIMRQVRHMPVILMLSLKNLTISCLVHLS